MPRHIEKIPPEERVYRVLANTRVPKPTFDQTCWFHLTRSVDDDTFEKGILPLNQAIDYIWRFLYGLLPGGVSETEFRNVIQRSRDRDAAFLYNMKVAAPTHWGPYAFLIRDIAFRARAVGHHDYLRVPEIVEDICNCYAADAGEFDLLDAFIRRTKPCIVKFADDRPDSRHLQSAIYYLYTAYHQSPYPRECKIAFIGQGVSIPKNRILGIEFPEYDVP